MEDWGQDAEQPVHVTFLLSLLCPDTTFDTRTLMPRRLERIPQVSVQPGEKYIFTPSGRRRCATQ